MPQHFGIQGISLHLWQSITLTELSDNTEQRDFPHQLVLMALVASVIGTALLMWSLWQRESLYQHQRELLQQQSYVATRLNQQLASLSASAQEDDTAVFFQLRGHGQRLWQLQWELTHNRSAGFIARHQQITPLYIDAPHHLSRRIDRIGDLTASEDPTRAVVRQLLQNEVNGTSLTSSIETVITELALQHQQQVSWRKRLVLLLVPLIVLLLAIYHFVGYLPLTKKNEHLRNKFSQASARLQRLSLRDPLTDTSNRRAITQFLSDFQRNNKNDGEFIALAIVDLDHFQQINDAMGYFAGDAVLKEVALRIQSQLRTEDRLGRTDGDHFAIVLCGLVAPRTAEAVIQRIQEAVTQPFIYKNSAIEISCTVGVSVQEVSSLDLGELFKLSDQALLQAKNNRRGSVILLSDQAQEALTRQRDIINRISEGNPEDLFELYYQPIVSLSDETIVGCECLLRWQPETPVDLHADEIIPILEMYGGIHRVGRWIIREGLTQLRQWQKNYPGLELFVSINVSALQLESDDFPETIIDLTNECRIAPAYVSLELTESAAIKHVENGRRQLALLRNYGFGVSLDDFGTGYSSLRYLKSMPVSTIKIDQAFVREMLTDKRDAAIIESTIQIAEAIGLSVVAEGIDNEEQVRQLQRSGCHYGQGYYFSKPMDRITFGKAIASQH